MAPALVATSFNEGCVPTSVNSDLFLPNALRQQLELLDNRRRYARDAYALSVLLASRQELTLIAGRQTADGDPLIPSRLTFATDPETMARRAMEFFRADESAEPNRQVVRAARACRQVRVRCAPTCTTRATRSPPSMSPRFVPIWPVPTGSTCGTC